jgi:hypothetical protein
MTCTIDIELQRAQPLIELVLNGPQEATAEMIAGVVGNPGPPGTNGAGITYTQTTPSSVWTITHNIGARPAVATFSVGGVEMLGTVTHLSNDVVQVNFSTPVAGTARLN